MDLALLALRVVVGVLFVGHGAQKLFGAFGGGGLEGTAGMFDNIGLRPGRREPEPPARRSSWAGRCWPSACSHRSPLPS